MSYFLQLRARIGKELLVYPIASAVIKNDKDEILLTKARNSMYWSFPGGGIEPSETMIQAVKREVKEEINMVIDVEKLLAIYTSAEFDYTYENGDPIHPIFFVMKCTVLEKGEFMPSSEIEAYNFFNRTNLHPLRKCCLQKVIDSYSNTQSLILR